MIVIVDDDVFASGHERPLQLVGLFELGFDGPHLIQTSPPWDPSESLSVNDWLSQQSQALREHAELVLNVGLEEEIRFPRTVTVRVTNESEPSWGPNPRLPLAEALRYLKRPLRLLVEDAVNDGAFLKAVAYEQWRDALEQAFDACWVEVEHGGGIPRMLPRVKEFGASDRLRLWVLFDSDAREPGCPSEESRHLSEYCDDYHIAYHQLRRRAAENYLPLPALAAWTKIGQRSTRTNRQDTYLAFKEMEPLQRHYYNMRRGFEKDEKDGIPPFFGELPCRPELRNGFGRHVSELFQQKDFRIQQDWLRKDGQQDETSDIIRAILRHM